MFFIFPRGFFRAQRLQRAVLFYSCLPDRLGIGRPSSTKTFFKIVPHLAARLFGVVAQHVGGVPRGHHLDAAATRASCRACASSSPST